MISLQAFDQTRYNMVDRSRVDYDFQNLYKVSAVVLVLVSSVCDVDSKCIVWCRNMATV
jgi:hypothetical protein